MSASGAAEGAVPLRPFIAARAADLVKMTPGPDYGRLAFSHAMTIQTLATDVRQAIESCLGRGRDTPFAQAHQGWVLCDDPWLANRLAQNVDEMKQALPKYGYKLAYVRELDASAAPTDASAHALALYPLNLCMCGVPMSSAHDGHEHKH